MKKIFKKNQVIITALAIMIAVAGYINYSDDHLGMDSALESLENEEDTAAAASDTDGIVEEIDSLDYDLTDESALLDENSQASRESQETESNKADQETETSETESQNVEAKEGTDTADASQARYLSDRNSRGGSPYRRL